MNTNHRSLLMKAVTMFLFVVVVQHLSAQEKAPDRTIKINNYRFDPRAQMPQLPAALTLRDSVKPRTTYHIVQFERPISKKDFAHLKSLGLKLNQSVSGLAYVEYLTPDQLGQLRTSKLLRWDGPYQPAFKIQAKIGQRRFKTPERRAIQGILLTAIVSAQGNISDFTAFLITKNARQIKVQDLRKDGFDYRVIFILPNANAVNDIALRPEVFRVFEVPEEDLDNGTTAGTMQSGTAGTTPVWNAGIRGENQIIHVKDSDLDRNHCFFIDNDDNTPGVNHRKIVNQRGPTTGSGHGTFVAGVAAGDDVNLPNGTSVNPGMAFNARITFSGRAASTFLDDLLAAKADGAFVHTNSWHNSDWSTNATAQYDQTAFDADNFLWNNEDHIILGSAGNNGEELGAPGTAKNAICVGATQDDNNEMNFGDGNPAPTPDGRRKPDMFTVGCGVLSATIGTACTIGPRSACATSYSTPAMAGGTALIRQYYQEGFYPTGTRIPSNGFMPSGALMKATLLNSTIDMTGVAGYPSNQEGWGNVLMDNALFFAGDARNTRVWDIRHADGVLNGETHTYQINVTGAGQILKIAMVYTDAPGTVDSDANVLTNDLDLVVTAPDGTTIFRGNNFAAGQSAAGGAADNLNNAEVVQSNTPPLGIYTIQVIGTAVTVGQPGQGYAIVASGDFADVPTPGGAQNTLVVRLREPGGSAAGLPSVQNKISAAASYVQEVSYGQTTIDPLYFPTDGNILLDFSYAHYYQPNQNPLIEMTEEVIQKLLSADANVFTRGTANNADDIDRLVFVINSASYTQEWATTGPWPYDLPTGMDRPISVSVNSIFNDENLFSHNICNQLGLWNLHPHPGVVFDAPHVDDWDLMAKPLETVGLTAWSKELVNWITNHGSSITFIPRPAAGSSTNQTLGLNHVTSTAANRKAIAIGLTPGVANFANETVYFMVEARKAGDANVDDLVPETGVLIYRVNKNISQGEGPVRIIDTDLTTAAGEPPLKDAALAVGQNTTNINGTGLDVAVAAGTGGANFNVTINFDPPETDNDTRITVGDPSWTSPDIWIDSQKDGFDENEGRTPQDRGDDPVTGEVNRIYVRINNPGDGNAFDFDVFVRVSEPYHTVGGNADFNVFVEKKHFTILNAGATETFFVNWTPNNDGNPHSCIEVSIPNVFNDVNPNNNRAQQNTTEVASTTASPYTSVTYPFTLTNPQNYQALFYFRPEGIPNDWTYTLTPRSAVLNAGEKVNASLTLQPPIDAAVCQDMKVSVSSWEATGNTLVRVGGGTVNVQLRKQTNLDITAKDTCNYRRRKDVIYSSTNPGQTTGAASNVKCGILSGGCTNPPLPFTEIVIKYTTEDGYPFYKTVTTDAYGCFSDFFETVEGGLWEVSATFPGDSCQGPATGGPREVNVPMGESSDLDHDNIPDNEEIKDGDSDGDGRPCLLDPDCDNDGVPDGEEDPGCILKRDCDGDGTPDGREQRKISYALELGSTHPMSKYSKYFDANVHAQFDLIYSLNNTLELQAQLGFHQFTGEPTNAFSNSYWLNTSLNACKLFPLPGASQWYARLGAGTYKEKSSSNAAGVNLGLGVRVPFPIPARMTAGVDFHRVFNKEREAQWLALHIGLLLGKK